MVVPRRTVVGMTTTKDRHKHSAIALRPPTHDREWLIERSERTGQPINAMINAAIAEYRRRIEAAEHRAELAERRQEIEAQVDHARRHPER